MSHASDNSPPNDELTLVTPTRFDAFPYEEPYDIQLQLMKHLYEAIESRSLAMYGIYRGLNGGKTF
jgi:chromosome transmission fidelity protein 1